MLMPSHHSVMPSSTSTQFNEVIRIPAALDMSMHKQAQDPQKPGLSESQPLPTIREASNGKITSQDSTTIEHKRPIRPKLSAPAIAPAVLRPTTNAGAWKAPDDWAVSPTESAISGVGTEDVNDTAATDQLASLTLDLAHMAREADRMRNASPQMMLQRLKDNRDDYNAGAVPEVDPDDDRHESFRATEVIPAYRDQEMESQRWLLSALRNMETIWGTQEEVSRPATLPVSQKILALFENQGLSSMLYSLLMILELTALV